MKQSQVFSRLGPQIIIWRSSGKPVFGIVDQARLLSYSDLFNIEILHVACENKRHWMSILCGCVGWYAPFCSHAYKSGFLPRMSNYKFYRNRREEASAALIKVL